MLLEGDDDKQFCDDEFSREQVDKKKTLQKGGGEKREARKRLLVHRLFEREKIFMIQASE